MGREREEGGGCVGNEKGEEEWEERGVGRGRGGGEERGGKEASIYVHNIYELKSTLFTMYNCMCRYNMYNAFI